MESKKRNYTTSAKAKESAALVKEDLWDLSEKWKNLTEKAAATTDQRPDETKLDAPNQAHYLNTPTLTEPTIIERLAGDKSIASFGQTFGRDDNSDGARAAASLEAEKAANPPPVDIGAKFLFGPEQVTREREKADKAYESDGSFLRWSSSLSSAICLSAIFKLSLVLSVVLPAVDIDLPSDS